MRQTILALILIFLIAATGYIWFYYLRDEGGVPAAEAAPSAALETRIQPYRLLQTLRPDLSVFTDPPFRALEPLSQGPDPSPPRGRQNPFTPF